MLSQTLLLAAVSSAVALAAPAPLPQLTPAPTTAATPNTEPLGTLTLALGPLSNTLIPILGLSSGGLAVGGIGAHSLSGVLSEHGNGVLSVGTGGVEVCLTQTFVVGDIATLSYGPAVLGCSGPTDAPAPTPTAS